MPYQTERPTLLGFICAPFVASITKKPLFGGSYVLGAELLKLQAYLYQSGAVLGRALQHRLDTLVKLLFVPGAGEHNVNETVAICKKDVIQNLEQFESQFGCKPATFDDFIFYRGLVNLLGTEGIALSRRDAYESYVHRNEKTKKILERKVKSRGIGQHMMTVLLQGIFFGSSFPELTEAMYRQASEEDRGCWPEEWAYCLVADQQLEAASLEEAEQALLHIVAVYASEYLPETLNALGLSTLLQGGTKGAPTE